MAFQSSEQQIHLVNELRLKLGTKAEELSDLKLFKFLTARNNDVNLASEMLVASLEWRAKTNVEEICREFAYPECDKVDNIYPRYFHKVDKIGRPIIINEIANLDYKKLLSCTTDERFLKEHVREIEKITEYRLPAAFIKNPKSNSQIFTILDLKGCSLSVFPSVRNIISSIARIDSDYYPETLGCMVIINAPILFTAIWAVVRRFLDQKTLSKIHIVGYHYVSTLLELIDKENLPTFLGGTCDCSPSCRNADIGPWNDGTVEGYPKEFWEGFRKRDLHAQAAATDIENAEKNGQLLPIESIETILA